MSWLKLFKTDSLVSRQAKCPLGRQDLCCSWEKNIMMPTSISRFAGCVLDTCYGRNEHGWLFELQRGKNS